MDRPTRLQLNLKFRKAFCALEKFEAQNQEHSVSATCVQTVVRQHFPTENYRQHFPDMEKGPTELTQDAEDCTTCKFIAMKIARPIGINPNIKFFYDIRSTFFEDLEELMKRDSYRKMMMGPHSDFVKWSRNLQLPWVQHMTGDLSHMGLGFKTKQKNEMPQLIVKNCKLVRWEIFHTTSIKMHGTLYANKELFAYILDATKKQHTTAPLLQEHFAFRPNASIVIPQQQRDGKFKYIIWKLALHIQDWSVQVSNSGVFSISTNFSKRTGLVEILKSRKRDRDDDDYNDNSEPTNNDPKCPKCQFPPIKILHNNK